MEKNSWKAKKNTTGAHFLNQKFQKKIVARERLSHSTVTFSGVRVCAPTMFHYHFFEFILFIFNSTVCVETKLLINFKNPVNQNGYNFCLLQLSWSCSSQEATSSSMAIAFWCKFFLFPMFSVSSNYNVHFRNSELFINVFNAVIQLTKLVYASIINAMDIALSVLSVNLLIRLVNFVHLNL